MVVSAAVSSIRIISILSTLLLKRLLKRLLGRLLGRRAIRIGRRGETLGWSAATRIRRVDVALTAGGRSLAGGIKSVLDAGSRRLAPLVAGRWGRRLMGHGCARLVRRVIRTASRIGDSGL